MKITNISRTKAAIFHILISVGIAAAASGLIQRVMTVLINRNSGNVLGMLEIDPR